MNKGTREKKIIYICLKRRNCLEVLSFSKVGTLQRHQWPGGLTTCVQVSGPHWEGEDKAGPTPVVQTGRSDLRGCEGVGNHWYCSPGASLCPKARGRPARSVVAWSRRCSQWHPKLGLKKGVVSKHSWSTQQEPCLFFLPFICHVTAQWQSKKWHDMHAVSSYYKRYSQYHYIHPCLESEIFDLEFEIQKLVLMTQFKKKKKLSLHYFIVKSWYWHIWHH